MTSDCRRSSRRRPALPGLTACLLPVAALGAPAADMDAGQLPAIAIIIDDLGNRGAADRRAAELPGPVACAILPHTPHAAAVARLAFANGKEVMLHQPFEAMDAASDPGPGSISLQVSRRRFFDILSDNIASLPHVTGVNNHMGSLLTRHPGHMRWLMEDIGARRDMFFVDSYTTERSVALAMAREQGVPAARRDVFLDNELSADGVSYQFERLKRLARERGRALAIAHPHALTLEFLERELPVLEAQGFRLVSVAELIAGARHEGVLAQGTRGGGYGTAEGPTVMSRER